MNFMNYKDQIIKSIIDIKQDLSLVGYITNFTIHDNRMERLSFIKNILIKSKLNFFVRIGGCEAFRDIQDCFLLGVDFIIVPLIESNYALKKFIDAIKKVYGKNYSKTVSLLSSIESIESLINFDTIYTEDLIKKINGLFIDFSGINNSIIFFKYNINDNIIIEKIINIIKIFIKLKKVVIINDYLDNKEIMNKYLLSINNFIFKNIDKDKIEKKNKFVLEISDLLNKFQI